MEALEDKTPADTLYCQCTKELKGDIYLLFKCKECSIFLCTECNSKQEGLCLLCSTDEFLDDV